MNPSPARNRADTTVSAMYGKRRRTSSPSSSSTSVSPNARWRATSSRWRAAPASSRAQNR